MLSIGASIDDGASYCIDLRDVCRYMCWSDWNTSSLASSLKPRWALSLFFGQACNIVHFSFCESIQYRLRVLSCSRQPHRWSVCCNLSCVECVCNFWLLFGRVTRHSQPATLHSSITSQSLSMLCWCGELWHVALISRYRLHTSKTEVHSRRVKMAVHVPTTLWCCCDCSLILVPNKDNTSMSLCTPTFPR